MHVKVFNFKAHVEMCNAATDEDKLHAWGNNVVDQSAKKAITSDNYTLMKRMERIAREREYVFSMMNAYCDMVCAISDRYFAVKAAKETQECCPDFFMSTQVHAYIPD